MSTRPETGIAQPAAAGRPAFRRVLLKLSGEALMGEQEYGISPERVTAIAREVKGVC